MKKQIINIMSSLIIVLIVATSVSAIIPFVEGTWIVADILNQNPDPARPGEMVDIRFTIGNYGSEPSGEVIVLFEPEYPFIPIAGEDYSVNIQSLNPFPDENELQIVRFKVMVDQNAADGDEEITLNIIMDEGNIIRNLDFDIEIQGREYAQIITIDKSKINIGSEENLDFVITNTGNTPLQNMVFSWTEESGTILPIFSDNNKYIKYLGIGDSKTVSYNIMADVNAIPGLYQLDLVLEFDSSISLGQKINTTAGIFIGGKTDFDVTFSEGESGKTSLSVANIGNTPAYSIKVVVPIQDNFKVVGSSSSIVGNLDKGDYTIVSFTVVDLRTIIIPTTGESLTDEQKAAKQAANFDNGLQVLVHYTDTSGVRHEVEKVIPIQLATTTTDGSAPVPGSKRGMNTTESTSSSIWTNPVFMVPAILVILTIVGIIIYRKRSNKKKH